VNDFENRSTFAEVMVISQVYCFFETQCNYVNLGYLETNHLTLTVEYIKQRFLYPKSESISSSLYQWK